MTSGQPAAAPFLAAFGFSDLGGRFALRATRTTIVTSPLGGPARSQGVTSGTWTPRGLILEPGLFVYDGGKHSISRRQLALAWPSPLTAVFGGSGNGSMVSLATFGVDPDASGSCPPPCGYVISAQTQANTIVGYGDPGIPFSMTTGGFSGLGQPSDVPLWGVAMGGSGFLRSGVSFVRIPSGDSPTVAFFTPLGLTGKMYQVTAFDAGARSLLLGVPARLTVDSLQSVSVVAEEPPKHVDWLGGQFENVSRVPEFDVELAKKNEQQLDAETSTGTDHTIGGSEEVKVSGTVKGGLFGIAKLGGDADVSSKTSLSVAERETDSDSSSTKISLKTQVDTRDDDAVGAYYQTFFVFRYPILGRPLVDTKGQPITGGSCTADCQGFLEIQVPGATATNGNGGSVSYAPGRALYWYQPDHQNGNALSYPSIDTNAPIDPPDLGTYTYKDAKGVTQAVRKPLYNGSTTLGGIESDVDLDFETAEGSTTKRTSKKTLTENVDVHAGLKLKFNLGVAKGSVGIDSTTTFDDENSWSSMSTGTTETTSSSSFTLGVPQVQDKWTYKFGTSYYYATDGSQKVRHGVDLQATNNGAFWWKDKYAELPDPGFNLPMSTNMVLDSLGEFKATQWNELATRQEARGFQVLQPPPTGQPLSKAVPLTSNPTDGDQVLFAVQVRNFSLRPLAQAVTVNFYAVPVDDQLLRVTGPPQAVGSQLVNSLGAQGATTVVLPWKAQRLPSSGGGSQSYRIFGVIDEANQVAEVHELAPDSTLPNGGLCPADSVGDGKPLIDPMTTGATEKLACGTNNRGFGTVTVSPPTTPRGSGSGSALAGHLDSKSLALRTSAGKVYDGTGTQPKVVAQSQVTGIVQVRTNEANTGHREVAIFDGPPERGQLIQLVRVPGVDADGTPVPFRWTPRRGGNHTITAVLMGAHSTTTGRADTLTLSVTPAPKPRITVPTLRPAVEALRASTVVEDQLLQTVAQVERAYKLRNGALVRYYLTKLRRQVQAGSGKSFSSAGARTLSAALGVLIVYPWRR